MRHRWRSDPSWNVDSPSRRIVWPPQGAAGSPGVDETEDVLIVLFQMQRLGAGCFGGTISIFGFR